MLIEVKATQAELTEMAMTPKQLANAILEQLDDSVPAPGGDGRTTLAGFDVVVTITE